VGTAGGGDGSDGDDEQCAHDGSFSRGGSREPTEGPSLTRDRA
jgi:hypothetical protein